MIFFLEMRKINAPIWAQAVGMVVILFMVFILIVVRIHYSIDVYAAIFFAAEMHSVVSSNLPIGDQIMCVPYDFFRFVFRKTR